MEGLGFAIALGLAALRRDRARVGVVPALAAVIVAEGLRSHANVTAPGSGALLTGVHLAAVAIWVGALLHVVRAALAWRREGAAVRWVLVGYVRLAAWVFAIVIGTGAITALLLVPISEVLTTTYGQILLIKLALVALAAALALTARRALHHSLGHRDQLDRVRTLTRLETSTLVAVLAASAVLVSTPPASGQQPSPPPPTTRCASRTGRHQRRSQPGPAGGATVRPPAAATTTHPSPRRTTPCPDRSTTASASPQPTFADAAKAASPPPRAGATATTC